MKNKNYTHKKTKNKKENGIKRQSRKAMERNKEKTEKNKEGK